MKRATFCQNIATQHAIDFNPRPHEEGDIPHLLIFATSYISIHALMKRATSSSRKKPTSHQISIHALMKRATVSVVVFNLFFTYFNPRPHEEGDGFSKRSAISMADISIHALMKRATWRLLRLRMRRLISIHALMKRATFKLSSIV